MFYKPYASRICKKLQNLCKIYADMLYEPKETLFPLRYFETKEHLREVPKEGWQPEPIAPGQKWGGEYGNLWLQGQYTVPEELAGQPLYLVPNTGAVEALLFLDGRPDSHFNSKGDYLGIMHSAQLLSSAPAAGQTFSIALECYAGHFCVGVHCYENYGREEAPAAACRRSFEKIDICTRREDIWHFIFDLQAVLQMAELPEDNFMAAKASRALEELCGVIVQYPVLATDEEIRKGIEEGTKLLAPLLEKTGSDRSRGFIGIIGHSHMDTAWLWPVSETVRKCARTYAGAVKLMKLYPEYKFTQSAMLHTEWMQKYYPTVFEDIKRFASEGRYELNGGVYVECDCNITSGELMARQFLYGQLYAREQFGTTMDVFWLPDTFGYNAAIPQLMRLAEIPYFYTTKMGWNDLNDFPYSSFRWQGIDGSEVLVHLHSIDVLPDVKTASEKTAGIKNKENTDMELLPFGHGDGGGGPTPAMLERARRTEGLPGLPAVEYTTTSEFMKRLEATSVAMPVYRGELYLELHRGTLTQMHEIKRSNRRCEYALHDLDYLNVLAGRDNSEEVHLLYKTLLKNQFHDILPGTTLTGVTDEAVKENDGVIARAKELMQDAAGAILTPEDGAVTLVNPTSFPIRKEDTVVLPAEALPKTMPAPFIAGAVFQRYTAIDGSEKVAIYGVEVPAFGKTVLSYEDDEYGIPAPFRWEKGRLETPFYSVRFDEDGGISSLIDKRQNRELRKEGGEVLNSFYTGEDVPSIYDNWDIDLETLSKLKRQKGLLSCKVVSEGPVVLRLRQVRTLCKHSTLTQDIVFYAANPRIDFETRLDWHDRHQLVKVGFALDIRTDTAKSEIQFGHIDRPTTANSSLEAAKFEVCQHKWTDLSESRYGVALLNDCKYGISMRDGDLRLTLQKSGTHPDTTGDEGVHDCVYSLLPHEGSFCVDSVVRPAYLLNDPLLPFHGKTEDTAPYLAIDQDNIVCEAVKPAACRPGAVVLRLYEAERTRTVCRLTLPKGFTKAYATNLLEDVQVSEENVLPIENGSVTLNFRPFEIKTILLEK